ncbi:unnamed protein product [Effrenium voratum]|nr:unnamed protein product [Effrenium voratum]
MTLTITNVASGEVMAVLSERPSSVKEAALQLANELGTPHQAFKLLSSTGAVLEESALIEEGTAALQAARLPLLRISVRCRVMSMQFIPGESQDLLLVTLGNLKPQEEKLDVLGADDGPESSMWFWRLFGPSYCPSKAQLIARKMCARTGWRDGLPPGKEVEETGNVMWPNKFNGYVDTFMSVHDESFAVFSWNQNDYLGGCANLEQLNLKTGEVTWLTSGWDCWDMTTDEAGTLFYISCYDGTDIHRIQDARVQQPATERTETQIVSQAEGLGFVLGYDASLKVLIISSRDTFFYAVGAPSEGLEKLCAIPGAERVPSMRPPADDHTPGDRTRPWETVKIPSPENRLVETKGGFYCNNGCVTFVDQEKRLRTANLFDGKIETLPLSDSAITCACSQSGLQAIVVS